MAIAPEHILMLTEEWEHKLLLLDGYSRDLLSEVDFVQRCAEEVASRLHSSACTAVSPSRVDLHRARIVMAQASQALVAAESAVRDSETQLANATKNHATSQQSLSLWQAETVKAQAWLKEAFSRVKLAEAAVASATSKLTSAENSLAQANSSLAWARSAYETVGYDKDNNPIRRPVNTAPYEAAVSHAHSIVSTCRQHLELARQELKAARTNHQAAQNRLDYCLETRGLAEQSLQLCERAKINASLGLREAEHAKASGKLAVAHITNGLRYAQLQQRMADQMLLRAGDTNQLVGEARVHTKRIEDANDEATLVACGAKLELAQNLLRRFLASAREK